MTREQIEGNILIAEFDGWKYISYKEGEFIGIDDYGEENFASYDIDMFVKGVNIHNELNDLKYHSSWDWIMPACKKFDSLNIEDEQYESLREEIALNVGNYEIQPVFDILVNAIKWYNKNK